VRRVASRRVAGSPGRFAEARDSLVVVGESINRSARAGRSHNKSKKSQKVEIAGRGRKSQFYGSERDANDGGSISFCFRHRYKHYIGVPKLK